MKLYVEQLEARNLLDASPIGIAIPAQISNSLMLSDGSYVALFDPDGPGPDISVVIGHFTFSTPVELGATLLPDGGSVNGFSLANGLDAQSLDFFWATQPGPYQTVTLHWIHSIDAGHTWGGDEMGEMEVGPAPDLLPPPSPVLFAADVPGPVLAPSIQTVQPEPIAIMPKELEPLSAPTEEPVQHMDLGLALMQDLRFHEPGDNN